MGVQKIRHDNVGWIVLWFSGGKYTLEWADSGMNTNLRPFMENKRDEIWRDFT